MSDITTQLRWVVEQALSDAGVQPSEDNWNLAYDAVGLSDYPIFDEAHRSVLNNKIIRHYYTREIGAETVGRFRMFVRDAMSLIMPYYNQLYESEIVAKGMEPLSDRNINHTEHGWGNAENTGSSTNDTKASSQNVYQDTPQNEMIPAQIKNLEYATSVTIDENAGNASSASSSNGQYDNMVERTESGYSTSQADLLRKYRDTFLNIDRQVVEDIQLAHCFMTIW